MAWHGRLLQFSFMIHDCLEHHGSHFRVLFFILEGHWRRYHTWLVAERAYWVYSIVYMRVRVLDEGQGREGGLLQAHPQSLFV